MNLKYSADISSLEGCPPLGCEAQDRTAFRIIQENPNHPNNSLPPAKIRPSRKFENDEEICSALALSFFISHDTAREFYAKLSANWKHISKALGTHVAKVEIQQQDGLLTAADDKGHFDLFESDVANIVTKISVIGPIL